MAQLASKHHVPTVPKLASDSSEHCGVGMWISGHISNSASSTFNDDFKQPSESQISRLTGPLENSDMGPEAPSIYQSCSAPLPTPGNRPSSQTYFNILVMGASNLGKTRFISDLSRAFTLEKSDVLSDVTSSAGPAQGTAGSFPRARSPGLIPGSQENLLRSNTLDNYPQELITHLPPLELPEAPGGSGSRGVLRVSLLEGPAYDEEPNRVLLLAKLLEYVLRQRERDCRGTLLSLKRLGGSRGASVAFPVHSVSLCLYFLSPKDQQVSRTDLALMSALSQVLPLLPMMASEGSLGPYEREGREEGSLLEERRQAVVEAMRSYVRNGQPTPIASLQEQMVLRVRGSGPPGPPPADPLGEGGGSPSPRPPYPDTPLSETLTVLPDADAKWFRKWLLAEAEVVLHDGAARLAEFAQRYEAYGHDVICMLAELLDMYDQDVLQDAPVPAYVGAHAATSPRVPTSLPHPEAVTTVGLDGADPVSPPRPPKGQPYPPTPDLPRAKMLPMSSSPSPSPTHVFEGVNVGAKPRDVDEEERYSDEAGGPEADAAAVHPDVRHTVRRAFAAAVANAARESDTADMQVVVECDIRVAVSNAASAAADAAAVRNIVPRPFFFALGPGPAPEGSSRRGDQPAASPHQGLQIVVAGVPPMTAARIDLNNHHELAAAKLVRHGLAALARAAAVVAFAVPPENGVRPSPSATALNVTAAPPNWEEDAAASATTVHGILQRALQAATAVVQEVDAEAAISRGAGPVDETEANVLEASDDGTTLVEVRVRVRRIVAQFVPAASEVAMVGGSSPAIATTQQPPQPTVRSWRQLGSELLMGPSTERKNDVVQYLRSFVFGTATNAAGSALDGSTAGSSGVGGSSYGVREGVLSRNGAPAGLSLSVGLSVGVVGLAAGTMALLTLRHK